VDRRLAQAEPPHGSDVVAKEPRIRDVVVDDHNETDDDLPTEELLGEGGLSDAPFEGPRGNGLIGVGGGAGTAFPGRGGHRILRAGGGGHKSDDTPADPTRESSDLRRRQEATTAPADARSMRTVAGRTFRREASGRWVDAAWDGKAVPERVEAYGPAYFALVASSDDVARILALGDRVLLVVGARVVEVVPAADAAAAGPAPR
jgi:hypothetical protein